MKTPRIIAAVLATAALTFAVALPASAAIAFQPAVSITPAADFPQISTDPATGNSLVVWQGFDGGPIYGQIVNKELGVVLPAVLISTAPEQFEYSQPFAEWNPELGNWLVVWDNDTQVWGRIFAPSGPVGTPTVLADTTLDLPEDPPFDDIEQVEAAWSTTSDVYLVGFKAGIGDCENIFGVLVNGTGSSLSSAEATVLSSDDVTCDVTTDNGLGLDWSSTTDEWLVTWYHEETTTSDARFIDVDGVNPGYASAVVTLGPNNEGGAGSVLYEPASNQFLVAWFTGSAPETELRGSWVLANHTVGASFAISDGTRDVRRPRLAVNPATSIVNVVAHSNNAPAEVWLWELPASSTTTVTNPQQVSGALPSSSRPVVTVAQGCTIVTWQDRTGTEPTATSTVWGRSSCATLPATGAADSFLVAGLAGAVLAAGAAFVLIASRRRTA